MEPGLAGRSRVDDRERAGAGRSLAVRGAGRARSPGL